MLVNQKYRHTTQSSHMAVPSPTPLYIHEPDLSLPHNTGFVSWRCDIMWYNIVHYYPVLQLEAKGAGAVCFLHENSKSL